MILKFLIFLFFGLGLAFARADLNLENRVRDNSSEIKNIAGDKFAGTWISRDGSRQILALTSQIDTTADIFKGILIKYVKYSEDQLLKTQIEVLGNLQKQHDVIYGTAIDIENNRIAVRAQKLNFDNVKNILESNGVDMNMVYLENQDSKFQFFPQIWIEPKK